MINMEEVRIKTSNVLKKNNVPLHPSLPLLDMDSFKSTYEVCKRIVSLYALAGLANGAEGDLLKEWLIDEGAGIFCQKKSKRSSKEVSYLKLS